MIHLDFILGVAAGTIEGVVITHLWLWWPTRKIKREPYSAAEQMYAEWVPFTARSTALDPSHQQRHEPLTDEDRDLAQRVRDQLKDGWS